jgi:hypothetical protein
MEYHVTLWWMAELYINLTESLIQIWTLVAVIEPLIESKNVLQATESAKFYL